MSRQRQRSQFDGSQLLFLDHEEIRVDRPATPWMIEVLTAIQAAGGVVTPERGGFWRLPDRGLFPPQPAAVERSRIRRTEPERWDWCETQVVRGLERRGLLERCHELDREPWRDPRRVTAAGRDLVERSR